ncbi:MAG: hypothetical protein Q8O67_25655 [Deltaproteobacteria bacterium]|nr:hypothetical protein [Deltaproteobacteria bacterium]
MNRKLWRDLRQLAGPAAAAVVVVAAGIMTFVALRGAFTSLEHARAAYFERARFAEVVARVVRAPLSVTHAIAALPGVEAVEARLSAAAVLDLRDEPARARIVSVHADPGLGLNRLHLRRGRAPTRGGVDEVVVNESFALARGVVPGATLVATIEGQRRRLLVTGVGGTPEFLYVIPPGAAWPDDERFAILWMEHDVLADISAPLDFFTTSPSVSRERGMRGSSAPSRQR